MKTTIKRWLPESARSKVSQAHRALIGTGLTVPATAGSRFNLRLMPTKASERWLNIDLQLLSGSLGDDVCFVQIGAYDGLANDPMHDLVFERGWRGILVEPQPDAFRRLCETYAGTDRMTLLNAAVADEAGERPFWQVGGDEPGDPLWLHQIASFDRGHVMRHVGHEPALARRVTCDPVKTVTLDHVFDAAPGPVSVLQIDAEGYDARIIQMLDFRRHQPTIVRFEHRSLSPWEHAAALGHLTDAGYRVAVNEDNTLAMQYEPGRGTSACR